MPAYPNPSSESRVEEKMFSYKEKKTRRGEFIIFYFVEDLEPKLLIFFIAKDLGDGLRLPQLAGDQAKLRGR